jgi:HEAT repeat protein
MPLPASFSPDIDRLLGTLYRRPRLLRLRGDDPREASLAALAATGDYRVVPLLLPFLVAGDELSKHAARAVETLARGISPAALAGIDTAARHGYWSAYSTQTWWDLAAEDVPGLCRTLEPHWPAIGMLTSHPSGFVREAATRELAGCHDGREIPFFALRANDWVAAVSTAATGLLSSRLVAGNRSAVLQNMFFIVRMLGQQRRDHRQLATPLVSVLIADDFGDVLQRLKGADTTSARFVYTLLLAEACNNPRLLPAALASDDAVVRRRAVKEIAKRTPEDVELTLMPLLSADRSPAVRKEALSALAERVPDRLRARLPEVLMDGSARVRLLAQYLAGRLEPSLDVRAVYAGRLSDVSPRQRATAADGLGECGSRADVEPLEAMFKTDVPKVQRAALRAAARLDANRVLPAAASALESASSAVRATALGILEGQAHLLDFAALNAGLRHAPNARFRKIVLRLLAQAPKWDAATYLLEALNDEDAGVRARAAQLLRDWTAAFNRSQVQPLPRQLAEIRVRLDAVGDRVGKETADLLRFVIKDA